MRGIEVFRSIIPSTKLINDNSGQHYKIIAGKSKWLSILTRDNIEGARLMDGFRTPTREEVLAVIDPSEFSLVLEHWKCQRSFDLANYESTFKPVIDIFSSEQYWIDDAWKYLNPVVFSGGDYSAWSNAIRGEGDGLPDNIAKGWWLENDADPGKDSLIRIIAVPKIKLGIEI